MSNRITLASGLTLNTRIDGAEGNPWLVLSNSLGTSLSMWDSQIEFLTQKYRLLRYDTRGHGGSDVPGGPYSFDGLVGDVIGLMDAIGIETAAFMGLSMGGMTGLGLSLEHADRIARVVCADGRADAPGAFRTMWDGRIATVEEHGLAGILEGTLAMWFTEEWRAANPQAVESIREMVLANESSGYIACCNALKELDYLRHLGSVEIPVLYVGGSDDKAASPEVMRAMAAATPGAVFHEIPNAGHIANMNQTEAFNAAVSEFLGL